MAMNKKSFSKPSILAAATLTAVFGMATMANAKPVTLSSCTKDGYSVGMKADVVGGVADADLMEIVIDSFDRTAKNMTREEMGKDGFSAFIRNIEQAVRYMETTADAAIRHTEKPLLFGSAGSCQPY